MARKSAAVTGRPAAGAAHEEHRRRGPRPKYSPALVSDLLAEFEAHPDISAREAAKHVVTRRDVGRGGSIDNRARHLLRLVKQEMRRPGLPSLELLLTWERVNRTGQRIRQRMRERDELAAAKIRAAVARWGGLFWRAERLFLREGPRWDNHRESMQEFLASLDRHLKSKLHLIR